MTDSTLESQNTLHDGSVLFSVRIPIYVHVLKNLLEVYMFLFQFPDRSS